ncbi:MerR family transcriptional regulator [Saccharopolyspora sp. K220]|uniref:MerR family transcriptional regulator n=1 Tax=Saccharopolyspora soli TaxID=2926618 RepID=UPI001F599AEC|nr:MerR family transcriptional regulator [Saccharopolyspora soli]MCI2417673.1 MerR family transcriptional regulator [Saccharopolyspora soli]
MKIGELSHRTGVSQRLLRYYEQQGLLTSERAPSGYRYYSEEAVTIVAQIRNLLAAGLNTETIRTVLPCARGELPVLEPCPDLLATLRTQLEAIDDRLACLQQTRTALSNYLTATQR